MQSQETIDPNFITKCRICWQESGPKINICRCAGSVSSVHEQCLRTWIEKSLQRGTKTAKEQSDGYTSIDCELCQANIRFKMTKQSVCLPPSKVQQQIKQLPFHFMLVIFVILMLGVITGTVVSQVVQVLVRRQSYSIMGLIFLLLGICLLISLLGYFVSQLVTRYFRGYNYTIRDFQPYA